MRACHAWYITLEGVRRLRQAIELPPQLRLSFARKLLSAPESERSSPIHTVEIDPAVLVVQGSQHGRGWSMVIDRASGALSGTIADAEGAFIVTGICTAS